MNDWIYLITPFVAWLICGVLKFLTNCVRERRLAFNLIGYGGFPSNHSTIVSSMVTLVALREGYDTAAFGVAITLAFIVLLDAHSLRKSVGLQAKAINELSKNSYGLRERIGHSKFEILAGLFVGSIISLVINEVL